MSTIKTNIDFYAIINKLNDYYSSKDIESTKTYIESITVGELFMSEDISYTNQYEMKKILNKIALFNNIDIINIIMHHANTFDENEKQKYIGCYIAAMLFKYDFDTTAEELITKYYLNKGQIIINIYEISCSFAKITNMISNDPESIQDKYIRKWILTYSARRDNIDMIKFLEQYYIFNRNDIFEILFNFSKSFIGSKELYIYIFNNYIDIIKNETQTLQHLITELSYAEAYKLIYFILSKIKFDDIDMINIFTGLFDYPPIFDMVIEKITDIMLNVWNMKTIELKKLYYQIENQNVYKYIQDNL